MKIIKRNKLFLTLFFIVVFSIGIVILWYPSVLLDIPYKEFYSMTKNDPLFSDASMDVSFLQESANKLKKIDDEILQTNEKFQENLSEKDRNIFPKGWRLWPDEFLLTLPSIHEATNTFLTFPTKKNATALLKRYEQATQFYKKGIQLHIEAMETVLKRRPEVRAKNILFLGSATTPEIVLNDFKLIQKNAEALEKEIEHRKQCLYHGLCSAKRTPPSNTSTQKVIDVPFLPLKLTILGIDEDTEIVTGPYWASTGCFGFADDGSVYNHPFYIKVRKTENEKTFLKPLLSNTKYYLDYRSIPKIPSAKINLNQGIEIRPHPEVNDYLCTDLRYLPELIIQYLNESKKITNNYSRKNKLVTLPYLLQHTLSFSSFLIDESRYRKKPLDPLYLLVDRSAYSLYFGTFSPAIWRVVNTPTFLIQKDFRDVVIRSGYKEYKDLISDGMNDEEIAELNNLPRIDEVYQDELSPKKK